MSSLLEKLITIRLLPIQVLGALNQISTEKNIPIINGVIVTNSQKEAEDRCGSKVNRGREFALAAIEMAQLKEKWTKNNQ